MVITLNGSVLFTSAKWELLPAAQLKLNDVAKALTEQDPDSKMVVEGHTDSQGMAASNQELSQKRAQAVRDYLVSRGIAADRITAEGFGSTRGVAGNDTAEGRANNRRVEIVVKPKLRELVFQRRAGAGPQVRTPASVRTTGSRSERPGRAARWWGEGRPRRRRRRGRGGCDVHRCRTRGCRR